MSKIDDLIDHLLDGVAMSIYDTREVVEDYKRVRSGIGELHAPMRIYDECDHDHEEDWPGWIDTGEFMTCEAAYLYSICRECCVENKKYPEQAEWCMDKHEHRKDNAICPTVAIITGEPTP